MKPHRYHTLGLLLAITGPAWAAPASQCDDGELADIAISAALGELSGLYNLGVEFYTGKCVKQSHAKAALLWERAVALDDSTARNNLAFLLYNARGVPKDEARAVRLWQRAADAGVSEAQIHLGEALFDGRGTGKDRALGLAWVLRGTSTAGAASLDDPTERRIVEMGESLAARMQAKDSSLLARATVLARSLPSKP